MRRRRGLVGQLGLSLAAQAPAGVEPGAAVAGELVGEAPPIVAARGGLAVEVRLVPGENPHHPAGGWFAVAHGLTPSGAAELIAVGVAAGNDRARYRVVKEGVQPC